MSILPMVSEANAMSEELNKKVKFEVVLISPQALAVVKDRTEVFVRMRGLTDDLEWLWSRNQFLDRKFSMQEMYQKYVDGDSDWDLTADKDPFHGNPDEIVEIGYVFVYTQCLSFLLDMSESLTVANYMGKDAGQLHVSLVPCNTDGTDPEDPDDLFVEDASELVGQRMDFRIEIKSVQGVRPHFQDIHCQFTFFMDKLHTTKMVSGTTNPEFNYSQQITYKPVTQQILENITNEKLRVGVFGRQKGSSKKLKSVMTTKDLMKSDQPRSPLSQVPQIVSRADDVFQLKCDIGAYKRRQERQAEKLEKIRKLMADSKQAGQDAVSIAELEAILSTKSQFKAAVRAVQLTQAPRNNASQACIMM